MAKPCLQILNEGIFIERVQKAHIADADCIVQHGHRSEGDRHNSPATIHTNESMQVLSNSRLTGELTITILPVNVYETRRPLEQLSRSLERDDRSQ